MTPRYCEQYLPMKMMGFLDTTIHKSSYSLKVPTSTTQVYAKIIQIDHYTKNVFSFKKRRAKSGSQRQINNSIYHLVQKWLTIA